MLEVKTLCDRERVQNNKTTKKLKEPAGRGIHFLENAKKKKKTVSQIFLLYSSSSSNLKVSGYYL